MGRAADPSCMDTAARPPRHAVPLAAVDIAAALLLYRLVSQPLGVAMGVIATVLVATLAYQVTAAR